MTKSTKTIIEKALRHYDEMIEWAKEQNPRAWVDDRKMREGINQTWYRESCPFCQKFFKVKPPSDKQCAKCPLYVRYGGCETNEWAKMDNASTWKTWIRHATRMREQIESLLEEVKG